MAPVDRFLPELRLVRPPTADSPRLTIRHLMTMTTGLPEDNPWGDQQLAISAAALRKFVGGGLSFSNPTGQQFEYSNLGFVLLGTKATGLDYRPDERELLALAARKVGADLYALEVEDLQLRVRNLRARNEELHAVLASHVSGPTLP